MGFFSRKKKEETKKLDLLLKENILLNQSSEGKTKDDVIRAIGKVLKDTGYITDSYIDGMLKREESFSTNIGNGIAIPHGVLEVKKEIKNSGIAVMVFPDGIQWNDEKVQLVVGIAGAEEEHLDILANIALNLSTPEEVEKLIKSNSVDYIYNIFTGK